MAYCLHPFAAIKNHCYIHPASCLFYPPLFMHAWLWMWASHNYLSIVWFMMYIQSRLVSSKSQKFLRHTTSLFIIAFTPPRVDTPARVLINLTQIGQMYQWIVSILLLKLQYIYKRKSSILYGCRLAHLVDYVSCSISSMVTCVTNVYTVAIHPLRQITPVLPI